jgi:hypothetical protein
MKGDRVMMMNKVTWRSSATRENYVPWRTWRSFAWWMFLMCIFNKDISTALG